VRVTALQTPRLEEKEGQELLQVPEQRFPAAVEQSTVRQAVPAACGGPQGSRGMCLKEAVPHGEPTLEQAPGRNHGHGGPTLEQSIPEGLSPMGGTPHWSRGRE